MIGFSISVDIRVFNMSTEGLCNMAEEGMIITTM
jgi:hypothetical protein